MRRYTLRSARSRSASLGVVACGAVLLYSAIILFVLLRSDSQRSQRNASRTESGINEHLESNSHVSASGLSNEASSLDFPRAQSRPASDRNAGTDYSSGDDGRGPKGSLPSVALGVRVSGCQDSTDSCKSWQVAGECRRNPKYMLEACKVSASTPLRSQRLFAVLALAGNTECRALLRLPLAQGSCGLCELPPLQRVVALAGGRANMPVVGFGTAGLGAGTKTAVKLAHEAGYRHFDTAQAREWYREDLVGQALRKPLTQERESLFITSKLHPRHLGYNTTMTQIRQSLADLDTAYIDLFMLHYPQCWDSLCGSHPPEGSWQDSWRALEALWRTGTVRAIGVSNFNLDQLIQLVQVASVAPHVVQVNSDPFHPNTDIQGFCRLHGIQFVGYSSLGSQWLMRGYRTNPVLTNPKIVQIAAEHGVAAAQVVLRWALQKGQVVIPRSSNKERMEQNLRLWEFELGAADMEVIDSLSGMTP